MSHPLSFWRREKLPLVEVVSRIADIEYPHVRDRRKAKNRVRERIRDGIRKGLLKRTEYPRIELEGEAFRKWAPRIFHRLDDHIYPNRLAVEEVEIRLEAPPVAVVPTDPDELAREYVRAVTERAQYKNALRSCETRLHEFEERDRARRQKSRESGKKGRETLRHRVEGMSRKRLRLP